MPGATAEKATSKGKEPIFKFRPLTEGCEPHLLISISEFLQVDLADVLATLFPKRSKRVSQFRAASAAVGEFAGEQRERRLIIDADKPDLSRLGSFFGAMNTRGGARFANQVLGCEER